MGAERDAEHRHRAHQPSEARARRNGRVVGSHIILRLAGGPGARRLAELLPTAQPVPCSQPTAQASLLSMLNSA